MNDTHVNESILSEEILEDQKKNRIDPVSYTHLTLPTNSLV